jgi:hypothetical protein
METQRKGYKQRDRSKEDEETRKKIEMIRK